MTTVDNHISIWFMYFIIFLSGYACDRREKSRFYVYRLERLFRRENHEGAPRGSRPMTTTRTTTMSTRKPSIGGDRQVEMRLSRRWREDEMGVWRQTMFWSREFLRSIFQSPISIDALKARLLMSTRILNSSSALCESVNAETASRDVDVWFSRDGSAKSQDRQQNDERWWASEEVGRWWWMMKRAAE